LEPALDTLSHARTEEEDDEQHTHAIMATNASAAHGRPVLASIPSKVTTQVTEDVHSLLLYTRPPCSLQLTCQCKTHEHELVQTHMLINST
jgi:hypothetical protein